MALEVRLDVPAAETSEALDHDIDRFDKYFQGIGNDPLTRYERAAIKTYLVYKVKHADQD